MDYGESRNLANYELCDLSNSFYISGPLFPGKIEKTNQIGVSENLFRGTMSTNGKMHFYFL